MARRAAFASILGTAALFLVAPGASADWANVPAGATSLNRSTAYSAGAVRVASIGAVPYATWAESDGSHYQVNVDRLAADGSGWEAVGGSLNRDPAQNGTLPTIADLGGVPYVAWYEEPAGSTHIYVDRLNAAGAWEPVGGALNRDASHEALNPSVASVGGVL
jgi:hypothetical protein